MRKWELDLMLFGEGGGAAGGAGDGGAGGSAEGTPGEGVLEDGTRVDHRLAERMQKQRERHPGRTGGEAILAGQNGNTAGTGVDATGNGANRNAGNPAQAQNAKTPEEEFDELIKGKYRSQYQARFQQGISERFKNQANLQQQLDGLKPMLDALAKQRGVEAGDYEALSKNILDDDSLYEDEAEEKGMTVEALKAYKRMEAAADAARAKEQQSQEEAEFRNHLQKLAQQGETLKQTFPDFDLMTELNNPAFRRMTAPDVGLSVEQAYYAVHHRELAPQAYAAGIQRATTQISQSIQANAARPVEGAMQGNTAAANIHIDPRNMTRAQREELKKRARMGEKIVL